MNLVKKLIKSELSLYIITLAICFGIFLVRFPTAPPQIPLYYSQLASEKQIADLVYIWILPLLAGLIIIVNRLFLAAVLLRDNKFITRIVHIIDTITIIIFAFIFIKIIVLVT